MERSKASLIDVTLRIIPNTGSTGIFWTWTKLSPSSPDARCCTRSTSLAKSALSVRTLHTATHTRFLCLDISNQWTPQLSPRALIRSANSLSGVRVPIFIICRSVAEYQMPSSIKQPVRKSQGARGVYGTPRRPRGTCLADILAGNRQRRCV
jgi:hypothetical protein